MNPEDKDVNTAFLSAPIPVSTDDGQVFMWIGMIGGQEPTLVAVDAEGYVNLLQRHRIRTHWRFLSEQNMWIDLDDEPEEIAE